MYIREIHYIKRKECEREFYEKMTKELRFQTYKMVSDLMGKSKDVYVVLGHNKDDIIENILNNISKKRDYFNLNGMDELSEQFNVKIWRPLLDEYKQEIYNYSKKYEIPYLKNTTPTWSSRGRLRNEFLPAMEKQFGKNMNESLFHMSQTFNKYEKLINQLINSVSLVEKNEHSMEVDVSNIKESCIDVEIWYNLFLKYVSKN